MLPHLCAALDEAIVLQLGHGLLREALTQQQQQCVRNMTGEQQVEAQPMCCDRMSQQVVTPVLAARETGHLHPFSRGFEPWSLKLMTPREY
jgi:hypothetical protein